MVENGKEIPEGTSRRRLLQSLSAVAAIGIAGCGSSNDGGGGGGNNNGGGNDGGDGGMELGERVPTITIPYWSDMGGDYTKPMEATAPVIHEGLEALGLTSESRPMSFSNNINSLVEDRREFSITQFGHGFTASRLDPDEFVSDYTIDLAGKGGGNWPQFANCEFTEIANTQANVQDPEERQELINRAVKIWTEEAAGLPFMNKTLYAGYNKRLDVKDTIGQSGIHAQNSWVLRDSEVLEGDENIRINVTPAALEKINQVVTTTFGQNTLIQSTLAEYDPEFNLKPILAESWESSDDGTEVTVNLRDGTFHNGDPITADDVAWTYNFIFNNPDVYYFALDIPWGEASGEYDFVEVIDDKTLVFKLEKPFNPLFTVTFPQWGILHKESWIEQGAEDDPSAFEPDPVIGSGPMELVEHRSGEIAVMTPHDGHPLFDVGHDLTVVAFQDPSSEFQALQNEEIDILQETAVNFYEQMEGLDFIEPVSVGPVGVFGAYTQMNISPTKFLEFRRAVGAVLNREKMNQLAYRGGSRLALDPCIYLEGHPWRPDDEHITPYTDKPEGDTEAAREMLADAGWGWDDDGNLHFPPDADLSPLWPAGEKPQVEDFPCMEQYS